MERIESLVAFLEGKKTYLVSVAMGLLVVAFFRGIITRDELEVAFICLSGAGLASLRLAVEKASKRKK